MPYRSITNAVKAQAVAYARQEGDRAAARRYGVNWRSVRAWRIKAAIHPERLAAVPAVEALDLYLEWCATAYPDAPDAILVELLRRANAELGQPRRPAVLTWFSGREADNGNHVITAGDVFDWAKVQTAAILTRPGGLERIEDVRRRWRDRSKVPSKAYQPAALDPVIAALLADADAYLATQETP